MAPQQQQREQLDPALLTALQNMQLPNNQEWVMDLGASSHMASDHGTISTLSPSTSSNQIIVGNGNSLPVTHVGSHTFPIHPKPMHLKNVLIVPQIIKKLISIRQFTLDNSCSIEFDPLGFSMKDLLTKDVILRCNSFGPLYSFCRAPQAQALVAATTTTELWHRRLGHPGHHTMSRLQHL